MVSHCLDLGRISFLLIQSQILFFPIFYQIFNDTFERRKRFFPQGKHVEIASIEPTKRLPLLQKLTLTSFFDKFQSQIEIF